MKRHSRRNFIPLGKPGPGYLTFHRVDDCFIKSPSVGLPMRSFGLALGVVLLGLIAFTGVEILTSDDGLERAIALLKEGSEAVAQPATLDVGVGLD